MLSWLEALALDDAPDRRAAVTLRIALDVTPELLASTGVARYSRELGRALDRREDCEVVRFAIGRRTEPRPAAVRHLPVPLRAVHPLWGTLGLPRAEHLTGRVDVVHSLDLLPPPTRHALVVTVHDLVATDLPELHPRRAVEGQRRRLAELGRAAVVITDTRTVADALAALGVPRERLIVIPLGLTRLREPLDPPLPEAPFVLAVGTLEPRKGHDLLVRAFAAAGLADHQLVFAGPTAGREDELRALAGRLGVGARLTILGRVEDRVLAGLYRDATLLCTPSLAEGFGLPVLEAMSVGLPVVASDIPVLREVSGAAALLVTAGDANAFADALTRVVTDPSLRSRLRADGPARAAAFTWEATAEATMRAYAEAVDRNATPADPITVGSRRSGRTW